MIDPGMIEELGDQKYAAYTRDADNARSMQLSKREARMRTAIERTYAWLFRRILAAGDDDSRQQTHGIVRHG